MNRLLLAVVLAVVGVAACRREAAPPKSQSAVRTSTPQAANPHETISTLATSGQQRKSPHETTSRYIEGNRVTIVYGRPYTNDPITGQPRKIWHELVPDNKYWRLGADEATLFITQRALELGGVNVPGGAYTLYMLLSADGSAQLLVNKAVGQFGWDPYPVEQELARMEMRKETLAERVDQLTIVIGNGASGGGVIKVMWEYTQYSVPFRVKK